ELLVARAGTVAEPAVRVELVEDITARAQALCEPLLDRDGVPEHIRSLTSPQVLATERDLEGRLAVRGAAPAVAAGRGRWEEPFRSHLDPGQRDAVTAITSSGGLVVIEGAAGAGKTTTLQAVGLDLALLGHRLVVVTPTLKAARIAAAETGTRA